MDSLEELIQKLRTLVSISSGTRDARGVQKIFKEVEIFLREAGLKTRFVAPDGAPPSLLGEITGKTSNFITLLSHADTVFEKESTFEGFTLSADRRYASGPGVLDDKAGILVAIEGVAQFLKRSPQLKSGIRFICTPSEEIGSPGYAALFSQWSKEAKVVLGFEPALPNGDIVNSRRGGRWYEVKVKGREAHAGRAHAEGINAAHDLAIKIDRLQRLTDYRKGITVNVGAISGGIGKFNVVCGNAEAKVDVRFSQPGDLKKIHQKILKIIQQSYVKSASDKKGTKTSYLLMDSCPPFSETPHSSKLTADYLDILKSIEGKRVKAVLGGGGADSNHFSRKGLPIIDGLGAVGTGPHTFEETVFLPSIQTRSRALSEFLSRLD